METVDAALEAADGQERRLRRLPARVVIYSLLAGVPIPAREMEAGLLAPGLQALVASEKSGCLDAERSAVSCGSSPRCASCLSFSRARLWLVNNMRAGLGAGWSWRSTALERTGQDLANRAVSRTGKQVYVMIRMVAILTAESSLPDPHCRIQFGERGDL